MLQIHKYLKLLFVFIFFLLFSCESKKQNAESNRNIIVDDLGNKVVLDSIPEKIISLAPNITEMLFELDCGDKIVGNTIYCNYPEGAKTIEKVGDLLTTNYEKIISLKPDIVFITVEGNTKESYEKLKNYGLKIFVSNPRNFNGIKKTFRDLANIFGKENICEDKISKWDSIVSSIVLDTNAKKESVMFLISLKPIMLAGKNTFVNEFIEICGKKNIAVGVEQNYPLYSREEILRINPDYIIFPSDIENEKDISATYPEWKNLKAFKNKNVIIVNPDLYFRPSPRFAVALAELNRKFTKIK